MGQSLLGLLIVAVGGVSLLLSKKAEPQAPGATQPKVPDAYDGVRAAFEGGDAGPLLTTLEPLREGRWTERAMTLNALDRETWTWGKFPATPLQAAAATGSPTAALAEGAHAIASAWASRAEGRKATEEERQAMHGRLTAAERSLRHAAEIDPVDPIPWVLLITVMRGLGRPKEDAYAYFTEAFSRDPQCYPAVSQMLAYLAEKFHGAKGEALEFARQLAVTVGPESIAKAATIQAHVLAYEYLDQFKNDRYGAEEYLRSPEVADEIRAAYASSLGASGYAPTKANAFIHQYALFAFYVLGDKALARIEAARIGVDYMNGAPWYLFGMGWSSTDLYQSGFQKVVTWVSSEDAPPLVKPPSKTLG